MAQIGKNIVKYLVFEIFLSLTRKNKQTKKREETRLSTAKRLNNKTTIYSHRFSFLSVDIDTYYMNSLLSILFIIILLLLIIISPRKLLIGNPRNGN